jgi:hypothetical protein
MSTTLSVLFLLTFFIPCDGQRDVPPEHAVVQTAARKAAQPLPSTVRIERSADAAALKVDGREFSVICRIKSKSLSFATPQVTVRDGERVTISDTSVKSIEVAKKTDGEFQLPIARDVKQGSLIEVTALGVDDGRVMLDVAAELQGTSERDGDQGKSVRVNTLSGRFIETVKPGEKATAEFDGWSVEVEVEAAKPDTAN